ncbi:MAG: hypothetical protein ACRDH7_16330 [Actinomycetota bacterium]
MEPTKRTINDPAEGLRYRLAGVERTQPVDFHAQLFSAVRARLGLQAADDPRSRRRGFLGRKRRGAV